ncbi:MAG TPA: phosphoribosylanthranilate isomerase [Beijerinckiaceae bacterium]|nr:phosphoribosylanthranilate isomerase [Beijerinckiaceae bacterium]
MSTSSELIVKICGLSTPPTLLAALDAGADMVGFVFFVKSPRNIDLSAAADLGRRVEGRARKVALVVDADDGQLGEIVRHLAPDFLQLHGRETPERVAAIKARFGLPVIKAIAIAQASDLVAARRYDDIADILLFDAKPAPDAAAPGGNGLAFDWKLLGGHQIATPWLLSGGLDVGNVAEALRLTRAPGIDVSSGVESAPGIKDTALIAAFVAAARRATEVA